MENIVNQFNAGLISQSEADQMVNILNMGSDYHDYSFKVVRGVGYGYKDGQCLHSQETITGWYEDHTLETKVSQTIAHALNKEA